ncbi:MAG: hypothetical protein HY741_21290 [Chloroflexi bacterium]|nr:hypothetical protein [Chloroflexota bacterium]
MPAAAATDLAYRVLKLEQQLESYQRLHAAELEEMRRTLAEIKTQVLALTPKPSNPEEEKRDE